MAGSRLLQPISTDPQQRQAERMAALEARVVALEAKRDLTITPLTFTATGGASSNQGYTWSGGRLWVMMWAEVVDTTDTGGIRGVTLLLNSINTGANTQITYEATRTPATMPTTASVFNLNAGAIWTPGVSGTVGFVRNNSNISSWSAKLLLFEWPQA